MTRGPYTFRGYYKSPQHNASAFDANGFYCSGDLISIDPEGLHHRAGARERSD